jgi:uncharacterized membrane-anchored protein YjiN (DUF445 family)
MSASEAALAGRLRRMQWLATGLVAAMALLFIAASVLRARYPGIGVVRAFAEAALIGGLADWFAVTALFRRPLGLPIPHTAIVPSRKNEIGRALARFVGEHFLVRDVVERHLDRIDLAERLGSWLGQERNARLLGRDLAVALDWLMRGIDSGNLREAVKDSLRKILQRIPPGSVVAAIVDVLASGNHAQGLVDQLVQFGRDQLDSNKAAIRERIRERSPWWLPKFVDEQIYDQLVSELERILSDVGDDPLHPARGQLNARLKAIKFSLGHDAELIARGETLRNELLDHPSVRAFAADVWSRARHFLHESLADDDSKLRAGLELELRSIGRTLTEDAVVRERLNHWLREMLIYVVENYRAPISEIISDTVEQWDAESTSRRIELQIGRDLQFIRINGTLVGGLVGVLLYFGWEVLIA